MYAYVPRPTQDRTVRQTLMIVLTTHANRVVCVRMETTLTPVNVLMALLVCTFTVFIIQ